MRTLEDWIKDRQKNSQPKMRKAIEKLSRKLSRNSKLSTLQTSKNGDNN